MVIPSYERPNDLYNCLLSLNPKNQKNSPPYEIIVTDDSKSRRCEHLVKEKFPEEKARLDAFVIQHKEIITNTSEEV